MKIKIVLALAVLVMAQAASAQVVYDNAAQSWVAAAGECGPDGCPPRIIWRPQPPQQCPQLTQPPLTPIQPPPLEPVKPIPQQTVKECDCGPKWEKYEVLIEQIVGLQQQQNETTKQNLAIVQQIITRIEALESSPAQPGPPGPPGKDGVTPLAPSLDDIADTVIARLDINALAVMVADKMKPSTLNLLGRNGQIIAVATITPGETSNAQLPPFHLQLVDSQLNPRTPLAEIHLGDKAGLTVEPRLESSSNAAQ